MILSAEGTPTPPSDIVDRLHRIHPQIDVLFLQRWDGGWWTVVYRWDQDDPRREVLRRSPAEFLGRDYDMLCMLPLDCPVAEAPAYLEKSLRAGIHQSGESLLQRLKASNDAVQTGAVDAAIESFGETAVPLITPTGKSQPRSFGGLGKRNKK